jgi:general secretion pathway protein D
VVFLQHADAAQLLPVLQAAARAGANGGRDPGPLPHSHQHRAALDAGRGQFGDHDHHDGSGTAADRERTGAAGAAERVRQQGRDRDAVEGANAIVIAAPAEVQRQLGEVIRQLDQRRPQVLVEAIIVEISDTAARQLGVQLLLAGTKGSNIPFAVTNYSNASPNILTLGGAIAAERLRTTTTTVNGQVVTTNENSPIANSLQEAAAAELLGSTGGLFGLGFRAGNAIFGAILNAVQSDNKSNLLATPSVVTVDNKEAHFLAGQEVPVTTGEALSNNFDNAFRTVQRQNVGISLDVTPQINAGDTVKLDIRQEVSSIAGTVGGRQSADLILNKREIETSIVVDDGDIIGSAGSSTTMSGGRSRRSRSSATFRWSATSSSRAGGRARRPTSWSSSGRPSSARRPTRGR